ncbi:Dehydrodolichyl diphosphate synthase 6 [Striga hermonthica]|uniref:Dehydrodolichyl diphosphate synthase 6 n=1 Tax=Striga hermonthica TaxID=68872 RepID=A0A9N7MWZ4_STRHE|nr:Dehydrodolichyl diphosphate synthase 6 [Striga hermonthica]
MTRDGGRDGRRDSGNATAFEGFSGDFQARDLRRGDGGRGATWEGDRRRAAASFAGDGGRDEQRGRWTEVGPKGAQFFGFIRGVTEVRLDFQHNKLFLLLLPSFSMEKRHINRAFRLLKRFYTFLRKLIFSILSVGPHPITSPSSWTVTEGTPGGETSETKDRATGLDSRPSCKCYNYELNVKHVTIYAFSIDNFKRRPDQLLSEPVKLAAERAMRATERNSRAVLSICLAYTPTHEIVHSVDKVSIDKKRAGKCCDVVDMADVDRGVYMAGAPNVDFQSACALLYFPRALWPEIGFWHLVWAVLDFLRNFACLARRRKQS